MTVPERQDAELVRTMTTYKRADGDLICGDYAFMTELDGVEAEVADSGEDYAEVVEETWQLVESRTIKLGRLDRWCATCDEDVTLPEPRPGLVYCAEHIDGYPSSQDGGA